jgi:hypothetical protein
MSGILAALAGIKTAIATAVDEYFNRVTLLLNTSSTNGAQNNTFLDSSTNNFTITRNGNTTQGTFTPFSQTGWSNYFNGSSTISFGTSSATNILAYDTFECWVNMPVIGTNDLIAGRDGNFWMGYNFTGIGGTANKFVFSIWTGSSWQTVSSTTTPVVGVWYHLLGVKDNTTMRFYVNGVQENTSTFSGTPVTTGTFYVASNNNIENFEGYISNLRLITGASNTVFPYSGLTTGGSFTPPTSALTAVTGTALLTCQSNRFVDNSNNNLPATITSIPSVQAFSPFAPTAAYSDSVVGGSGYFDGTGDYLATPSTSAFNFGTGAFTIECWIYQTALSGQTPWFFASGSNGAGFGFQNTSNWGFVQTGVAWALTTTTLPNLNAWNHVVVCRASTSSNQASLFLNGVRVANGTISQTISSTGAYYCGYDGTQIYNGYISGLRVNNTDVYGYSNTTITVPTAPLTAITNTSLLLNYTNAGIYDSAAKNVLETVGNAQVSTTQAKFGTTSMAFDGTGDNLLVKRNNFFDFGTGDFTVEVWVYFNSVASIQTFVTNYQNSSNGWGLQWRSDTGAWNFFNGDTALVTYTNTPSTGTWIHAAVARSGTSLKMFINGTQVGSVTNSTNISGTTTDLTVGSLGSSQYFNGYMDDMRITKGYARYTATFTAPTAAFPLQ